MLFITYFELNPDMDPSEIGQVAQTLLTKGVFPPEGIKMLAWYVSTGDYWGITIAEAESEEAGLNATAMWRIAKPGIFKVYKTTPAMKAEEMIPILARLAKTIKEE